MHDIMSLLTTHISLAGNFLTSNIIEYQTRPIVSGHAHLT